jgi:hypothetical protein
MPTLLVFAVNPILAIAGQIAAIVICLFLLILVLLAVAVNLGMAFGLSLLRDKIEVVKKLRPYVESINTETKETVRNNALPEESENRVARVVANVPLQMNKIDQKIEQTSDRVANAVIEFRARTEQAKIIARIFFLPGSLKQRARPVKVEKEDLQFQRPGYRPFIEGRPEEISAKIPISKSAQVQEQVMHGQR